MWRAGDQAILRRNWSTFHVGTHAGTGRNADPPAAHMVVLSDEHRPEIEQHLVHWPGEYVIVQPENRDTTAGILLPLVHIASRDPAATVAIFPSDHFIANEQRFIDCVRYAVSETY